MDGSGTTDRVDRAAQSAGVSERGATHTREVDPLTVTRRLQREGRWKAQAEQTSDELMQASKGQFKSKKDRQAWAYAELDRMYPPVAVNVCTKAGMTSVSHDAAFDSGQIQGLGDVPNNWPDLPSNASLAAEVGWVQANRLRIVEERPGGATRVRLDKALSVAPSWSALGWLETSIRSYAKFVDVAAKVSGGGNEDNESSIVRRERRSIDEVRALLDEMKADSESA